MEKAKGYADVDYLKLVAEITHPVKDTSYNRMKLRPGQKVLDVGCGPGTDTISLAHLLGPDGRVVGIDFDAEMVSIADEQARVAGVTHQVTHHVGDACQLPFETDEFDASRSERLFQHLLHPEKALEEMIRVTKPGGWVVVVDTDWATASVDSELFDLERRLARIHPEYDLNNGCSGRKLFRFFKLHGLTDITIDPFLLFTTNYNVYQLISSHDKVEEYAIRTGIATEQECARLKADLIEADEKGIFYTHMGMVLVAGSKPAD